MSLYEALTLLIGLAPLIIQGIPWFIKTGRTLKGSIKKLMKK